MLCDDQLRGGVSTPAVHRRPKNVDRVTRTTSTPWLRVVACVLTALACAVPTLAQDAGPYRALVARYANGQKESIPLLVRLGRELVARGVSLCTSEDTLSHRLRCSPRELVAAAVLHADAADAAFAVDPDTALMLIDAGMQLLAPLLPSVRLPAQGRADVVDQFIPRWYAYMARMCSAYGYTKRARALVFEGVSRFEKSPDLYVARGVTTERDVQLLHPDLKGDLLRGGFTRKWMRGARSDAADVTTRLVDAAADYRRALGLQPSHTGALIHLGWTHFLLDDGRAGRELTQAMTVSSDSRDRYVALLFRGAAAERRGQMTDALRDYDEARRAGPSYQTACVASVHARYVTGDRARAHQLAAECLMLPAATDASDPWWLFRSGLAEPSLGEWLREVAWRR